MFIYVMADFDIAIENVLKWEGGYVNDPDDPGGETKYGISKRSFPHVDIKNLTVEDAKLIYRKEFWNKIQGDRIESQAVANKLLDMAVNIGPSQAVHLLQNILDLKSDGLFGPRTLEATNEMDPYSLLVELRFACAVHYAKIVAYKPSQLKYINGWMRRALS